MAKKKFIDLKEGDIIYHISMTDSELNEAFGTCLKKLEFAGMIRTTDMYSLSIRTKGGTFFTTRPNVTFYINRINQQDEVNLSFEVFATTREEAIEEAQKLVTERLRTLNIIKRRLNESETGLLLADTALDTLSTEEEEPSLEEFASMAL